MFRNKGGTLTRPGGCCPAGGAAVGLGGCAAPDFTGGAAAGFVGPPLGSEVGSGESFLEELLLISGLQVIRAKDGRGSELRTGIMSQFKTGRGPIIVFRVSRIDAVGRQVRMAQCDGGNKAGGGGNKWRKAVGAPAADHAKGEQQRQPGSQKAPEVRI